MDYPSRIRIVSETGLVKDTRVFDVETERELTPNAAITGIDLTIRANDINEPIAAVVYCELPALDIVAEAEWVETVEINVDPDSRESIEAAIGRLQLLLVNLEGQHGAV